MLGDGGGVEMLMDGLGLGEEGGGGVVGFGWGGGPGDDEMGTGAAGEAISGEATCGGAVVVDTGEVGANAALLRWPWSSLGVGMGAGERVRT